MKMKKPLSVLLAAGLLLGSAACNSDSPRGETTTAAPDAGTTTSSGPNAADVIMDEAEIVNIDENQETGTIKVLIYYDLVTQDADLVDLFETRYNGSIEQEICSSGAAYFESSGRSSPPIFLPTSPAMSGCLSRTECRGTCIPPWTATLIWRAISGPT